MGSLEEEQFAQDKQSSPHPGQINRLGRVVAFLASAAFPSLCTSCAASSGTPEASGTSQQALEVALPNGPVNIHLDGWAEGGTDLRGIPVRIQCDVTGTSPGAVGVGCYVSAVYDGMAFRASGSGDGNGVNAYYRFSRGNVFESGDVSVSFLRKDDTLWARAVAQYRNSSGRSFDTVIPMLVTLVQGGAVPTELTTTAERATCKLCLQQCGANVPGGTRRRGQVGHIRRLLRPGGTFAVFVLHELLAPFGIHG